MGALSNVSMGVFPELVKFHCSHTTMIGVEMEIWRHGHGADHGDKYTSLEPQIGYSPDSKVVVINAYNVKNFQQDSHHDWTISVNFAEICAVVLAAASATGGDDAALVAKEMAPALTSLLRLATEAAKEVSKPSA